MTRAATRALPRTAAARDELDMAVAQELGDRYQVERRERCGPLSCVYLARDVAAGQVVALKVLPHAWRQERASEGFEAAMAAWATLDHPHIIPVRGFGRTSQLLWYAMPHIDGRSLDDVLRNGGPLEPRACLRLVEQLAAALHYAHRGGVTPGNVKPSNVMMASAASALLSDFALARALEAGPPHDAAASRSRVAHYVTPEERHARQLGPAADQYGLAVLALECLEGAASPGTRPPVPRGVREALTRALSPDPQDRYATVLDLVAALAAGAAPTPAPASVSQPTVALARPPVAPPVLWDDAYEPGGPRARTLRRGTPGAGPGLPPPAARPTPPPPHFYRRAGIVRPPATPRGGGAATARFRPPRPPFWTTPPTPCCAAAAVHWNRARRLVNPGRPPRRGCCQWCRARAAVPCSA